MGNKTIKGKRGELLAADYLEKQGYRIVERNYRFHRKEVDLIAIKNSFVVFVEVKNWDHFAEENIEYSINLKKQRNIIEVTNYFLIKNKEYDNFLVRFDIIFITGDGRIVDHIKNAFSEV